MQSQILHARQVSDCTVGHISDAAERPQDRSLHVSEKSSHARWFVQVLQHHNSWRRNLENAVPPVGTIHINSPRNWRLTATQSRGGRIPDHGREILEDAANASVRKAGVAQPYFKRLDRIRNRAGV